ncbi:hypothetical protein, partial [Moorena sp. SIO3I6]|uniref:hypothetical protein n=1 Tax=Moorena sp. SIO3I6 TaxID=2607831 RepID=UPI0013F9EEA3
MDQSITSRPESPQQDLGSAPGHKRCGLKKGKSKELRHLEDFDDTTWTQSSLFQQQKLAKTKDLPFCMPEFQAALKKPILSNKYSFSSLVTQKQRLS